MAKAPKESTEKLHFEIDGGIDVFNTKEALQFVRKNVQALPKTEQIPTPRRKAGRRVPKFRTADQIFESIKAKIAGDKSTASIEKEVRELQGAIATEEHMAIEREVGDTQCLTNAINVYQKLSKEREKAYGAKNVGVTKAEYEKLKAEEAKAEPLRGKRAKGFRKGAARIFTAADLVRAGKIGMYHFEAGSRQFADWSARMIKDLGEHIKPHLEKLFADAKTEIKIRFERN